MSTYEYVLVAAGGLGGILLTALIVCVAYKKSKFTTSLLQLVGVLFRVWGMVYASSIIPHELQNLLEV